MKKLIKHIIRGTFNSTIFNPELAFLSSLLILPILITLSMVICPECFTDEIIATPKDIKTLGILILIDIVIIIIGDFIDTLIPIIKVIRHDKKFCKEHHLIYKFDVEYLYERIIRPIRHPHTM